MILTEKPHHLTWREMLVATRNAVIENISRGHCTVRVHKFPELCRIYHNTESASIHYEYLSSQVLTR